MKHKRGLSEQDSIEMESLKDDIEIEVQLNPQEEAEDWDLKPFEGGGFDDLLATSWPQYALLVLNMAAPTFIMVLCLWILKSAWIAALTFHLVACLLMPFFYITCFSRKERFGSLITEKFCTQLRLQCGVGAAYFAVVAGVGFLAYWAFGRLLIPNKQDEVMELGISGEAAELAVFGAYFVIVNPIVEEFFWRAFLIEALGASETRIWIISCCYALYHGPVLAALDLEWILIGLCVMFLCLTGRVFAFATSKTGVFSAALAHSGGDLVIIGILWDWFLDWLNQEGG